MSRARVKVIDRGWNRQIANTRALATRRVKLGIQSGAGEHGGTDLVDILIFNEFGTRTIPARPVMRGWFDTYAREIGRESDNSSIFMLRTGHIQLGLSRLGAWMQADLQRHWRASKSWAVPNTAYTIRMKGSDVPLIDHGVLINAVRWTIV